MADEDHDSDSSDSTVLLPNYNEAPERNEAKRRRLTNLYHRCTHPDQHEDENIAPGNVNIDRRTNISPKTKSRNWRISKYFDNSYIQNNHSNDQPHIQTPHINQNRKTLDENEIISIDSDDDDDIDGKNLNQDINNVAVFNKGESIDIPVRKEIINAKLKVLHPTTINARTVTAEVFGKNYVSTNSEELQKLEKDKQLAIEVLKPSAINSRRATNALEGNYCAFNNINNESNISINNNVDRETITETHEDSQRSQLKNADGNVKNLNVDKHNTSDPSNFPVDQETNTVAPEVLDLKKTHLKNNRIDDTPSNEKRNKRILDNDETTHKPKRSRTDMKSTENILEKRIANSTQAGNLPASNEVIKNRRNSIVAYDLHKSNTVISDQIEIKAPDTRNKNEARNDLTAHGEQVLMESKLVEAYKERETSEVLNQQGTSTCSEHVTCESLNMKETNKLQSDLAINEAQIRQNSLPHKQLICETLFNRDTDKAIIEEEQNNKLDVQRINKKKVPDEQNTDKVENDQYISKKLNKQELSGILTISEAYNSQDRSDTTTTSEPIHKQETIKLQDLKSSTMLHLPKVNTAVDIDVAVEDFKTSATAGTKNPSAKSAQLNKDVYKVQNDQVLSESQNNQAMDPTSDNKTNCKSFINYESGNVQDQSLGKMQGAELDKQNTRNVQKNIEPCENYDMQASDKIHRLEETDKAQDDLKTHKIKYQPNVGRTHAASTVQDSNNTSETQDKHKCSNVRDNDIVRDIHGNKETNKESDEQTTRLTLDKPEERKTQDGHFVSIVQDAQGEKITSESQYKKETKEVSDERKTTKTHDEHEITNKQRSVEINLLQFQIKFFSIIKDIMKTVHQEFGTSFDNVIQTLKANHRSGIDQTVSLYNCPKCTHKSAFSTRLINMTNIDEAISKDDRSQKCIICFGTRKLYITYLRRYVCKIVSGNGTTELTDGAATTKDHNSQAHEHIGKRDKGKINERSEEANDSQQKRACTEHNNEQNGSHFTNLSKDNLSNANANLVDEQPSVQNKTASDKSKSLSGDVEENPIEKSQANYETNYSINKSQVREQAGDNTFHAAETGKNQDGSNPNCSANVEPMCVTTPGESPTKSKKISQIITANLSYNTHNVNIPNKDQGYEIANNSIERENIREENINDIEKDTNKANSDIPKKTTEGSDNDNKIIAEDEESQAINENNFKSLTDCFTKIKNLMSSGKESKKKEQISLPVSTSERTSRFDKLPDHRTDNRADVEYICHVCSNVYENLTTFLIHLSNHNIMKCMNPQIQENCISLKCKHCYSVFKRKESLNKHVREQHSKKYAETVVYDNLSIHNNKSNNSGTIKKKIPLGLSKNGSNITSGLSQYKYRCRKCGKQFKTDYAARNHRKQKHPECRYQKIYDKVGIERETHNQDETNENEDEKLNENESENEGEDITYTDSNTDDETETAPVHDINLNPEESCNSEENSLCDDDAYATRETGDDRTNDSEKRGELKSSMPINTTENERQSEDSCRNDNTVINNNQLTRRVYECLLCKKTFLTDWSSRKHRLNKHPDMIGAPLFKRIQESEESGTTSNEQTSSRVVDTNLTDNEGTSSSKIEKENNILNYLRRKVELVKNRDTDRIYETDELSRNVSLARRLARDDDDHYFEDGAEKCAAIEKCNKESVPNSNNEEGDVAFDDDIVNVSESIVRKKNERIAKFFVDEFDTPDQNNINEKHSDLIVRSSENCNENQLTTGNNNLTESQGENSDNDIIRATEKITEKRKERQSKLFGDDNESSVSNISARRDQKSYQTNKDSNGQCQGNEDLHEPRNLNICEEKEVVREDESIKPSKLTVKKRKDHINSFLTDDEEGPVHDSRRNCNEQTSEGNANGLIPSVTTNLNNNKEVVTIKDKYENKDERHVERYDVENNGNKKNTYSNQSTTKETCCEKDIKNPNVSSVDGESKTGTKASDNDIDRTEIDMIDNLLKEYDDNQANGGQPVAANEKENCNRYDQTSQVSKDKMQINDDDHNKLILDKTCLDTIQITNVISVKNKIYLFVCQECQYATDIYDDTIRHCQNHFNEIQDLVIYCNVCQIKYDNSCFERHEGSHDKYLDVIKVTFSYQWLFSKWHSIFENIPLSVAEDIQVKSIYKTFAVKMTVAEEGAWHSALYLCGKCNICVPSGEIEEHVREQCPSLNYLCSICNRAFVTHEMREHHKLYHEDDNTNLFKIIAFNNKNDDAFNLNLTQAKAGSLVNQGTVDIFKCLCGLCFGSLKKLKLHFVECELETNDGTECRMCAVSRRFTSKELEAHLLMHESGKCYFRVQKITFQLETNNDNLDQNIIETADTNTDNTLDFEIKRDMLKEESLSQEVNVDTTAAVDVNVQKRDHSKDKVLSRENNDEHIEESTAMNVDTDLLVKRELKDDRLSQETTISEQSEMQLDEDIDTDLQVKRDLLKEESLSENTIEYEHTEKTISDADIDLHGQGGQIIESLSQETMEVEQPETPIADNNDRDVQVKSDVSKEPLSLEIVEESQQLITIEDSDPDSDVEFIE